MLDTEEMEDLLTAIDGVESDVMSVRAEVEELASETKIKFDSTAEALLGLLTWVQRHDAALRALIGSPGSPHAGAQEAQAVLDEPSIYVLG